MIHFESSLFALAGLVAATGPIVIHLLNRRRYRQVSWAAMDFLRQALERNKRILHLRDLILLALRVLAVVLVGLALARPYYRGTAFAAVWHGIWLALGVIGLFGSAIWGAVAADAGKKQALAVAVGAVWGLLVAWCGRNLATSRSDDAAMAESRRQPVHAVLLIDNSLSLKAESVGATLFDKAKAKAREFLVSLPAESRMTVIPVAGSEEPFTLDAYRHREDAEKAIEQLAAVDTTGQLRPALESAVLACQQVTELPAKRAVLITDMQRSAFQETDWGDLVAPLGGLQIAPVADDAPANVWLSDFHLEDGLASVESPCRFLARVESTGGDSPVAVLLRLLIDGVEVGSQTVDVAPGQTREVVFTHQLDGGADPERANFVLAELELQTDRPAADRLAADNRRALVIPVVAALPVVFVDEYGADEDFSRRRIGETYALRHLLAPKTAGELDQRRLIRVIHVRQDQLTEEVLRSARLVVMAGVERPDACVSLLREFVLQGGPLVILAGGRFDPAAWTELAWLDGRGILPAPLKTDAYGVTPDEAPDRLKPFFADFAGMQHDFFQVEQEDPEQLAALFESTPFFKAVQADLGDDVLSRLLTSETQRFLEERELLAEFARQQATRLSEGNASSAADRVRRDELEQRSRRIEPAWWRWRSLLPFTDRSLAPAQLAERQLPRVLAEYKGLNLPFVVERPIGAGRVVLVTSGVTSDWNLLRVSGAMYMFHRMISSLIEQTFPARNFEAGERIVLPVDRQTDVRYQLTRPSGREETLNVEALTSEAAGVQIRSAIVSGAYRIVAEQPPAGASVAEPKTRVDEWVFAVNGPASESDLTRISPEELTRRIGRDDVRVLDVDESIDVQGGARRGQRLWQACLSGVLLALFAEMLLLGWPAVGRKEAR
jgi:hypothetical protein